MSQTEIRITGFGGQGVILAGYIIGKAASVHDDLDATMIQSYGPEARGSACSAQVVVSDDEVHYPYVAPPGLILVDLSRGLRHVRRAARGPGHAALRTGPGRPGRRRRGSRSFGVPVDPDRREDRAGASCRTSSCSASSPAGPASSAGGDAQRRCSTSVPAGTEDLNLRAFDAGWGTSRRARGAAGKAAATPIEDQDGTTLRRSGRALVIWAAVSPASRRRWIWPPPGSR